MPSEDLQVPRRVRREGRGFKGEIDGSTFQQCLSQNQGEQGLEGPEETPGVGSISPARSGLVVQSGHFLPQTFLLAQHGTAAGSHGLTPAAAWAPVAGTGPRTRPLG